MLEEPTNRMLKARHLRMKGFTLDEIAATLVPPVTRQGARHILQASDKFYELQLGSYEHFRKYKKKMKLENAKGKKGLSSSEKVPSESSLSKN